MAAIDIALPYNYTPRRYQEPFWKAMTGGIKRAALVWHRRSGKDKTALNFTATQSQFRVGTYYYFLPTYRQGKKIIWDGIDRDGFKFLDHIPKELIAPNGKNETEMQLELKNGAIIQLIGAENIDSIVGTNPVGVVYSEYSLIPKRAWDLVRPILRENGGWAVFIFTPRGKNHAFELYQTACREEDWFAQVLTIEDTYDEAGRRIITEEDIEQERREGMDEELIQQEYFCSFTGSLRGAYYSRQIEALEAAKGRIGEHPHDPAKLVHTAWDFGIKDAMAIWSFQMDQGYPVFIDYWEESGVSIADAIRLLRAKGYDLGTHLAPHDVMKRDPFTGETMKDSAFRLNFEFTRVPKLGLQDGINAARMLLPKCKFDGRACGEGLNALKSYRKKWDEALMVFSKTPVHDWASNGADAFRIAATGLDLVLDFHVEDAQQVSADSEFDPYTYAGGFPISGVKVS